MCKNGKWNFQKNTPKIKGQQLFEDPVLWNTHPNQKQRLKCWKTNYKKLKFIMLVFIYVDLICKIVNGLWSFYVYL